MRRRQFIKSGIGALATLAIGETILLTPEDVFAVENDPLNYSVNAAGTAKKMRTDYRTARSVKSVCLNCSTVCGIEGFVADGKVVEYIRTFF